MFRTEGILAPTPQCSEVQCSRSPRIWDFLWSRGFNFQGDRYCNPACCELRLRRLVGLSVREFRLPPRDEERRSASDILLSRGRISASQLDQALDRQALEGGPLEEWLVKLEIISRRELTEVIAEQLGLPWIEQIDRPIREECFQLIPPWLCLYYRMVAIDRVRSTDKVVLAVGGAVDVKVFEALRCVLNLKFCVFVTDDEALGGALQAYRGKPAPPAQVETVSASVRPSEFAGRILREARSKGCRDLRVGFLNGFFWARILGRSGWFDYFWVLRRTAETAGSSGKTLPVG